MENISVTTELCPECGHRVIEAGGFNTCCGCGLQFDRIFDFDDNLDIYKPKRYLEHFQYSRILKKIQFYKYRNQTRQKLRETRLYHQTKYWMNYLQIPHDLFKVKQIMHQTWQFINKLEAPVFDFQSVLLSVLYVNYLSRSMGIHQFHKKIMNADYKYKKTLLKYLWLMKPKGYIDQNTLAVDLILQQTTLPVHVRNLAAQLAKQSKLLSAKVIAYCCTYEAGLLLHSHLSFATLSKLYGVSKNIYRYNQKKGRCGLHLQKEQKKLMDST